MRLELNNLGGQLVLNIHRFIIWKLYEALLLRWILHDWLLALIRSFLEYKSCLGAFLKSERARVPGRLLLRWNLTALPWVLGGALNNNVLIGLCSSRYMSSVQLPPILLHILQIWLKVLNLEYLFKATTLFSMILNWLFFHVSRNNQASWNSSYLLILR